jgi:hypothetical protein
MFTVQQSVILVDHAARMGADLGLLRSQCSDLAGRNGVTALRRALELADPRSESAGERLTRELLHRLRITPPELQYLVQSPYGEHRLDFAGPERKVALANTTVPCRIDASRRRVGREASKTAVRRVRKLRGDRP